MAALKNGADSVMTARRLAVVEMLANEDIPVMGHLGLVPRKSTWRGGLRAVGRTAEEALALMQDFRDLENAGAFSVEAEVIPAEVMSAISPRTGLITVSLLYLRALAATSCTYFKMTFVAKIRCHDTHAPLAILPRWPTRWHWSAAPR